MIDPSSSAIGAGAARGERAPVLLARDMLAEHLGRLFAEQAARNAARRATIRSPQEWEVERQRLLAAYRAMLGRFPERTPLNPRCTGTLDRPAYTIEKLLFESQPGLLVTALAYVPKAAGGERAKRPAVLVPCGHSENGKAAETYQRVCSGLAAKGFFVLTYDPIGQGERQLYWDAREGRSALGGCTTQHSYAGNQCLLLGISLAQLMIWDSIRAIDYLCTRPEVDPERIGMAGNSGGGTNVAYTAPLDERVKVAVPCCYITTLSWRRRSWTTGDAEQNLLGQLPAGLDHADLLRLIAPRPLLVGSAALDYFPLAGARESVAAARALYALLGVPERIGHVVAAEAHGYSVELRRATYRWLSRWLGRGEEDGEDREEPIERVERVERDEDLQCTPEGQVALLGSASIATLLRRRLEAPTPPRTRSVAQAIRELTRCDEQRALPDDGAGTPMAAARPAEIRLFRHEGVRRVETLVAWPEPDVAVPGTLWSARTWTVPLHPILVVDGEGADALRERPAFRRLVDELGTQPWLLAAIDVRGIGETAPRPNGRPRPAERIMGAEAFLTYESLVAGRPLFGMRLRDVAAALEALLAHAAVDATRGVDLVGWGAGGLLALHLAALEPRVARVATIDTLHRFRSLVEHEHYAHPVSSFIPGVVAGADSPDGYDLDDVAALIAPRPVLRLRDVDHLARPLSAESEEEIGRRLLEWLRRPLAA